MGQGQQDLMDCVCFITFQMKVMKYNPLLAEQPETCSNSQRCAQVKRAVSFEL